MSVKRILCIRFSSLGDIMLTVPVCAALRGAHPGAVITFVTKNGYAPFLAGRGAADDVAVLPEHRGFTGLLSLAKVLRRRRYDLVVDLHANLRSRLLTALVGGTRTVRYAPQRSIRTALVKRGAAGAPPADHTIKRYAAAAGVRVPDSPGTLLTVDDAESRWAAGTVGTDQGRPLVTVFPGGKHGPKRYPPGRVRELCTLLAERYRVLVIDSDETFDNDNPADVHGATVVKGQVAAGRLLALLALSRVLVSTDSGPMHAAGAVGTPVVALFGPTHPALGFAPAGAGSVVLHSGRECSPCSLHGSAPCRLGLGSCTGEITPGKIVNAVDTILA